MNHHINRFKTVITIQKTLQILILGGWFVSECNLIYAQTMPNDSTEKQDNQKISPVNIQKETMLNEVTVRAKKTIQQKNPVNDVPKSSHLALPESCTGVEVITSKDIETMRPADVYDIFETGLGISIRRQGSRVHNWVMDRGAAANSIGLILDGIFISSNEATRILGDLSINSIESIKIIRDASQVTIGPVLSNSSGSGSANQGFIIMTTKHAQDTGVHTTEAHLSYGSYNTLQTGIFHGEKHANVQLSGGYTKNRNDKKVDNEGNWFNSCDANLFWGNLDWKTKWFTLKVSGMYDQVKRDIQRYQEADGTWGTAVWTYNPINTVHSGAELSIPWTGSNTTLLTFGYTGDDGNLYMNTAKPTDYMVDTIKRAAAQDFYDKTIQGNVVHTIMKGINTLKIGVQLMQEGQKTEGSSSSSLTNMCGFYASDEIAPGSDIVVDIGARIDKQYVINGTEKYTSDSITTKNASHMWLNDAWTVAAGCLYIPKELFSVSTRLSFTAAPTPSTMSTINRSELNNEQRLKIELGPSLKLHPALNIQWTGFYYSITDAKIAAVNSAGKTITLKTKDGNTITVYDAHDVTRSGFEFGANGKLLTYFRYDIGFSLAHSDYAGEDTSMARWKITGKLNFQNGPFGAGVSGVSVPAYYHNNMPVGNFNIVNAEAQYQFPHYLTVSFYGRNITNQKYTTNYKGVGSGYFYDIGAVYGLELKVKI